MFSPRRSRATAAALIPQANIIIATTAANVAVSLITNEAGEYTARSISVGLYNVQKKG